MRVFTAISLAASAAFSLFASASPVAQVDGPIEGIIGGVVSTVSDPSFTNLNHLGARDDLPSIPVILANLTAELEGITAQLEAIAANNATAEALTPLLDDVVSVIGIATTVVGLVSGDDIHDLLLSVQGDVSISVAELAQILSNVLSVALSIVATALKTVDNDLTVLGPAVDAVGTALADLTSAISGLVGGLIADLTPLVTNLVPTLGELAYYTLAGIFNIVFPS